MDSPETTGAKSHYFEAGEEDEISCGDCGAGLDMSDLACSVYGGNRLRPSPDFVRLALHEIEPGNYGRREIDEVDRELNSL